MPLAAKARPPRDLDCGFASETGSMSSRAFDLRNLVALYHAGQGRSNYRCTIADSHQSCPQSDLDTCQPSPAPVEVRLDVWRASWHQDLGDSRVISQKHRFAASIALLTFFDLAARPGC